MYVCLRIYCMSVGFTVMVTNDFDIGCIDVYIHNNNTHNVIS